MNQSKKNCCFVITYRDPKDGEVRTLKAATIRDSSLGLAFIAISDFIFEHEKLVITPDQEALEKRLVDVKTLHLSIYSILSVCEYGTQNKGLTFKKDRSNLVMLPGGDQSQPKK